MKKNILTLAFVALLALILVACDPATTEEESDLTRITITFTDNVRIEYGTPFDVMAGVTAIGDDDEDYTDLITYTSTSTISSTHMLNTTAAGDHLINYRVTVGNVVAQRTRSLRVNPEVILEWIGFNMTVEQDGSTATITYSNTPGQWWSNNAQLAVVDFDGTKNAIEFTFTGVAGHTYLFKIEGPGGIFKETPIEADGTEQTHTLDLSLMTEAQRSSLNLIILFVQTTGASGTVVVNNWTYGEQLEVTEPEWNGVGMNVEQTGGQVTITYADIPANWWEKNAQLPVVGFDGSESSITFTFTGVEGHSYLFKIEGPGGVFKETPIVADGTEQTHTLDLSAMTVAQRQSLNLIVVFVQTENAAGSVVVKGWMYGEPIAPSDPEWAGYGMTVVETEDDVTITYADTPGEWWNNNAQLPVIGFDGTKNSVEFTFTGVDGHEYLFKIEGPGGIAKEEPIVADGTEQTITLDLTLMTEAQRASLNLIIVFVKTEGASGTFVVNTWTYGEELEVTDPEWTGYGMEVVETEDDVTITYADISANWWEKNAQYPIIGFDGTKNSVAFTFTGVDGHLYLFKVEGPGGINKESEITADGTEQTITLDLTLMTEAQRSTLNLIIVFVKTEGASGSVVVNTWAYGEQLEEATPVWAGFGMTVDDSGDNVTITYADTPEAWWNNNAQLPVVGFDGAQTSVTFTFVGVEGQSYLFKVEGPGVGIELAAVATGAEQVVTLDLSGLTPELRSGINKLVFFSNTPGASGTVEIISAS